MLANALQDVRHGLRVLAKNPGFALIAIATLALGIGVNTAIFSVVYGVLLRPLPYHDGGRLVILHQQAPRANIADIPFSVKEIQDYRNGNHTLDAVVEHHTMFFLLLGKDWAERVQTGVVSANFFDVLGVKPLLGRTFVASDDSKNADAVLVLSYQYWKTRHGGDPNIVGKVFQMNNRPHTVIGVLPPIPQYPTESDVYMPTSGCPFRSSPDFIADRQSRMMNVFGRMKPGVPIEQARADLSTVARQMAAAYPDVYPKSYGYDLATARLQDELSRRGRTTFLVLLGAAGLVLLIACANVANLLLSRFLKLERELAVRVALGATKLRLVRQLLTESLLLSLGGGALGLALAPGAVKLLASFAGRFTTRASEVVIDAPVLVFTALIAIATGFLFGLAPAFSSSRGIGDAIKQGGGRATASRGRQRLRSALVVAQVAISFMLLIGAGLVIRSFLKLTRESPGFRADHLLTMRLSPNFSRYNMDTVNRLRDAILLRVPSVAGVESAAMASNFPFNPTGIASGPQSTAFEIEGRRVAKGELAPRVNVTGVSAGYFQTVRQPAVSGRVFERYDDTGSLLAATINQTLARHRWPNENPVGKRITFDGGQSWDTIVGVVADAKEYGIDHAVQDEVYLEQKGFANRLVLRTSADPMSLAPAVRAVLRDIDPQLAVDNVNTVEHFEHESMASPRVIAILLGLFAALALAISASGIAAVMALSVTQRTSELGIRLALGASRWSLVYMVMRSGLALAIAGTVVGLAGSLALTRLLTSLLYAISPTDALTFTGVALLFFAVAAAACFVPAHQVIAIDPLVSLRQE